MSMTLKSERPKAADYVALRLASGMGRKDEERSRHALAGSAFVVCLYDDDRLVGFGRVVGDGGLTYVISDIMVAAPYQRQGWGKRIMAAIDRWLSDHTAEDSFVCLIANRPADRLYEQFGFRRLPETRCGMLRDQTKAAARKDRSTS